MASMTCGNGGSVRTVSTTGGSGVREATRGCSDGGGRTVRGVEGQIGMSMKPAFSASTISFCIKALELFKTKVNKLGKN